MEFLDLSPYAFLPSALPMTSVGWLESGYGVQGADGPAMSPADVECLRAASWRMVAVCLGFHECEFCDVSAIFLGNGEYHYFLPDGVTYAAPMMILHYVEEHGYRPPAVFRSALRAGWEPVWDERAERLREVLLDESAPIEFRADAIIDLANWRDPRTFEALMEVTRDEELTGCAGHDLGRSLALFRPYDFAAGLQDAAFTSDVRYGFDAQLSGR